IELEQPIPNLHDGLCGKAWGWVGLSLDALPAELGLTPIDDLTSCTPEQIEEMSGGERLDGYEEEWFDPAVALHTVQGLYDHLKAHPEVMDGWEDAADLERAYLFEDMEEAMKILRAAIAEKVRVHFNWAY